MKIIDLLNRIANGEEIKKFKYYGGTYIYDEETKKYWFKDMWFDLDFSDLNDEVEVIEEEQEDKKMKRLLWCNVEGYSTKAQLLELKENLTLQFNKINEIIDKINKENI